MKKFKAPRKALSDLDAEAVATVIMAAADIALIIDRRGVIKDIAMGQAGLSADLDADWIGKPFTEVVTGESEPKVRMLLAEGEAADLAARQLNHPGRDGTTIPISYSLRALGADGLRIAVGRDLRGLAELQQRLIEAEQSLERDYSRLRLAETRYRLLLQSSTDPILIIDAATQKVVDLNSGAAKLLGGVPQRLVGQTFGDALKPASLRAFLDWLTALRTTGRADVLRVRFAADNGEQRIAGALFRQENVSHVLLRITPVTAPVAAQVESPMRLADIVRALPDALVVTDGDGRVFGCNRAFLDLAQLATEEQARNESLERWLGRPGVDLGVLLANLKQHGTVRLFATSVRGELGSSAEVEISAVGVGTSAEPIYGFAIRNVDRRRGTEGRPGRELPRSVEQLTELVGRVSLKELVRETTDVIERLCIEAALELTADNRASAAEMLGLSRQSLYVKLRRYGLGDLDDAGVNTD
ncbi:MAG: transcriptional regulator PpsR [Steroidobacteraceae bacterium]